MAAKVTVFLTFRPDEPWEVDVDEVKSLRAQGLIIDPPALEPDDPPAASDPPADPPPPPAPPAPPAMAAAPKPPAPPAPPAS